jgi:uncharacterized protein
VAAFVAFKIGRLGEKREPSGFTINIFSNDVHMLKNFIYALTYLLVSPLCSAGTHAQLGKQSAGIIWACGLDEFIISADPYSKNSIKNLNRSAENLKHSAESGDIETQFQLAVWYESEGNFERAWFWYDKAGQRGNSYAQLKKAIFLQEGRGVRKNDEKALLLLRDVANSKARIAQFAQAMIGLAYMAERGTQFDGMQAKHWLNRAAKQDCVEAQKLLASLFSAEPYVDPSKTVYWQKKIAGRDYTSGEIEMINTFLDRQYKREKSEIRYSTNGIENSVYTLGTTVRKASRFLGETYEYQFETPQHVEAILWYKKSATFWNDEQSQFRLGEIYESGIGVSPDSKKATYWFGLAARNGRTR